MIKKIKNNTANAITFFGIDIPPGEYYTILAIKWLTIPDNYIRLLNDISSGVIIANDGTNDLSPTEGAKYIQLFQSNKAADQIFNNATNGFIATNVQAAIEEVKNSSSSGSIGIVTCDFDGNGSVGRYLEFGNNIESSVSPFIVPMPCTLRAISISVESNATTTLTVYKNGASVATISLSNAKKNRVKNLSIALTDLDQISVKITSGSCSKIVVALVM